MSVKEKEEYPSTLNNYFFLFFLTVLNALNFIDRQLLASFANFIVPDLGLTNTEFGMLTGILFVGFYAVAGLFMGTIADLVHRPRLIAAALVVWSSLTAASGAAKSFIGLAIPRVFIGVGESVLTPAALSMLADRFPSARLGFVSGVYYMGVPLGAGASLLAAGFLAPVIGWRTCFYILGGIGLVLALLMLLVKEDPEHGTLASDVSGRMDFKGLVKDFSASLVASKCLQLTIAAGTFLHFVIGVAAFDQLWMVQERGYERVEIAILAGTIGCFAGLLGNLFGGIASDYWQKITGKSRVLFIFWMLLLCAPINIVYRLVDGDSFWFLFGLGAGFFQLGAFYGPTFSTIQELCPVRVRATVVAFSLLIMNIFGVAGAVTLSGIIIDALLEAGVAEPYSWALLIFSLLAMISIPLFYMASRYYSSELTVLQNVDKGGVDENYETVKEGALL